MIKQEALIFEKSVPGRKADILPMCDVPELSIDSMIPEAFLRAEEVALPEVSEIDTIRHFTALSQMNHGVDSGFYPLGSCTMKYNPKVNEAVAQYCGFTGVHPYQPEQTVQGCLEVLYQTDRMLAEITGMERVSLQPAAGAHGEMAGLMIIKAYHQHRGDTKRQKIVVPDSSHGTNPASAAVVGFDVIEVKSNPAGGVDLEALQAVMSDEIAGLMLTNPSTLGLFEENIVEIAKIVHQTGGLLYYDGANMNAIMGKTRPGDMGFDVVHLNLHKTFSTPHGGGGPGSGPVGVKKELVPFLPGPVVESGTNGYYLDGDRPLSIGRVKSFYGNFLVVVKAFSYIRSLGAKGLREASEMAVLNANYIRAGLCEDYELPFGKTCMHEVVFSAQKQAKAGVSALDIAKRLIDFGYHPPTIYFPLIVKEALMIEPTETESKETLDAFIAAMKQIAREAKENPEVVKSAPHDTIVGRLDEVKAVRKPVLKFSQKADA
ncbi:aminomethyl-transferring glycine dehydrogenase subunit GcvPB [Acetobacterium wieringae]|uniref:aminomethyl-transferring glycine dehydrogenase subunit GcvPB n=1 Tax=Acetobacterium wieringae TaxID=52694 RepID=UPI0023EB9A07|nr:aminomethyl-transferring glycine dehydrogenase subunit GcvPB [Acetobacterium wieringae]